MDSYCKRCNTKFKNTISLIRHRQSPFGCRSKRYGDSSQKSCLSGSLISYLKNDCNFKPILCKTCEKAFSQFSHLFIHLRVHTNETPYVCDYCSKTFMLALHLGFHLESHKEDIQLTSRCGRCVDNVSRLMKELNIVSSSDCFSCPFCNKVYTDTNYFLAHLRMHYPENSICSECGHRIVRTGAIISRMKVSTAASSFNMPSNEALQLKCSLTECERCGRSFEKINQLSIHLLSHITDTLFSCKYCQEVFGSRYLLKKHVQHCQTVNEERRSGNSTKNPSILFGNESFNCPFCKKNYSNFGSLQVHLPTHAANAPSKSDIELIDNELQDAMPKDNDELESETNHENPNAFGCGNARQQDFNRNSEEKTLTGTDSSKGYNCDHCPNIFKSIEELELHKKSYSEDNLNNQKYALFSESSCSSENKTQCDSMKLLYKCSYCEKFFISAYSLNSHIECHFGKPPFRCKVCSKTFTQSDSYLVHEKRHTVLMQEEIQNNLYKVKSSGGSLCEVCGEVFQNILQFNEHLKSHADKEIFKCTYCPEVFYDYNYLNEHTKQHLVTMTRADDTTTRFLGQPRVTGKSVAIQFPISQMKTSAFPYPRTSKTFALATDTIYPNMYSFPIPDYRNDLFTVPVQGCPGNVFPVSVQGNRVNVSPVSPLGCRLNTIPVPRFCSASDRLPLQNPGSIANALPLPSPDSMNSMFRVPISRANSVQIPVPNNKVGNMSFTVEDPIRRNLLYSRHNWTNPNTTSYINTSSFSIPENKTDCSNKTDLNSNSVGQNGSVPDSGGKINRALHSVTDGHNSCVNGSQARSFGNGMACPHSDKIGDNVACTVPVSHRGNIPSSTPISCGSFDQPVSQDNNKVSHLDRQDDNHSSIADASHLEDNNNNVRSSLSSNRECDNPQTIFHRFDVNREISHQEDGYNSQPSFNENCTTTMAPQPVSVNGLTTEKTKLSHCKLNEIVLSFSNSPSGQANSRVRGNQPLDLCVPRIEEKAKCFRYKTDISTKNRFQYRTLDKNLLKSDQYPEQNYWGEAGIFHGMKASYVCTTDNTQSDDQKSFWNEPKIYHEMKSSHYNSQNCSNMVNMASSRQTTVTNGCCTETSNEQKTTNNKSISFDTFQLVTKRDDSSNNNSSTIVNGFPPRTPAPPSGNIRDIQQTRYRYPKRVRYNKEEPDRMLN